MRSCSRAIAVCVLFAALNAWSQPVDAAGVYRWVDKDGNVHYGDHVPPEYAKGERDILNDHGIAIKTLPREPTAEELAAMELERQVAEAERLRAEELQRQDTVLLNTYMSVEEIKALRNRRKELLDGRIRVTELYLNNLRSKLAKLQKDASQFQPYNSDPEAPPIHDWLAKELANTLNSIFVYEQTLEDTRTKQLELVAKFEADSGYQLKDSPVGHEDFKTNILVRAAGQSLPLSRERLPL